MYRRSFTLKSIFDNYISFNNVSYILLARDNGNNLSLI